MLSIYLSIYLFILLSSYLSFRLSRLFTHWELEGVRDRRDRILNKLYARFLQALCDVSSSTSRGIYKTAGTLYRWGESEGKIREKKSSVENLLSPANEGKLRGMLSIGMWYNIFQSWWGRILCVCMYVCTCVCVRVLQVLWLCAAGDTWSGASC